MPQYQGVWTLEQQAQAQSNQQWVTDPNFKNTTLLLQADGTGSGSQNQTFLDGSTNNFFITRNGNTTQGSFSPFSQAPGYWGNYFGSNNYLTVPYNANFLWSTGARTYEAWIYVTSVAANNAIFALTNLSSSNIWELYVNTSSQVVFRYFASGAQTVTTTGTVPLNTWVHVAFVYDGTSAITIYINGVSSGTGTKTGTPVTGSDQLCIGRTNVGTAGDVSFNGYISNARFTTTTVYTSNFTPQTTPLTAITNTTLLTCQSNRFVDNSASPATITANGTPSVQAFGPFAPALQWTSDVVGGSGYFDGSGDYLSCSVSASPKGTQNFTIEGWAYVPSAATDYAILIDNNSSGGFYLRINSSGQINVIQTNIASILTSSSSVKANSWNYFCVTRSGNTFNIYLNSTSVDATTSNSVSFATGTATFVGADYNGNIGFSGYMSSLRVVLGTATAPSSIPTAPLTAITNTSLLLNYTNAGIYDGKMANVLETVGNAQVSTSIVKYGSGSMYFDGTGDYLVFPNSQNFAFGSGDFTVEAWVYLAASKLQPVMDTRLVNANLTGIALAFDANNYPYVYVNNAVLFTSSTPVSLSTWTHVAMVRANGIITLYVNGTKPSTGSASNSTNLVDTALTVGSVIDYRDTSSTLHFNGFMDDLRITKGVARYTANFTPPQQALPRQ